MKALTKWLAGGAAAAAAMAAAPASAQYYDYRYDRNRDVVEEVVDGVARVATAVAVATQGYHDPYSRSRYGYGYGRGFERHAVDACAFEAQRRYSRYGRVGVDIRDVRWDRGDRLRVFGAVDLRSGSGWYDRYSRYDRYGYGRFDRGRIAFTCTVRRDGRVTSFRTHNYAW